MKRNFLFKVLSVVSVLMVALTSLASSVLSASAEGPDENATEVIVTDIHGEVTVPKNPERIVALDNRTFETLAEWGVKPLAVPKDVMSPDGPFVDDDSIENVGNHREPNLEVIAAANPDLVIIGQRFAKYYEEIKELVPDAAVVDFSFDVSGEDGKAGENLVNGFRGVTTTLGLIFDKMDEADALLDKFDAGFEEVKAAYNKDDSVMAVVVSGGEIGFSAPHSGRVWGPLYDVFEFKPALEVEDSSSDHKGDDISVEAIAESDPDWLLVLDRDAAVASAEDAVPAMEVIEGSEALKATKAVADARIAYAPNDTYTNESIQTFIEIFDILASTFAN